VWKKIKDNPPLIKLRWMKVEEFKLMESPPGRGEGWVL
jgi:hypothetical protein